MFSQAFTMLVTRWLHLAGGLQRWAAGQEDEGQRRGAGAAHHPKTQRFAEAIVMETGGGWVGFGWALGSWKRMSCCDYLWLDIFFLLELGIFTLAWRNMPFIKGTGEDEIFRFPQLGIWHDLVWRWKGFKSLGIMAPTQGEHQCLEQINTILPRVAGVPFFGLSMSCQSILYIIIWILRGRAGG